MSTLTLPKTTLRPLFEASFNVSPPSNSLQAQNLRAVADRGSLRYAVDLITANSMVIIDAHVFITSAGLFIGFPSDARYRGTVRSHWKPGPDCIPVDKWSSFQAEAAAAVQVLIDASNALPKERAGPDYQGGTRRPAGVGFYQFTYSKASPHRSGHAKRGRTPSIDFYGSMIKQYKASPKAR